MVQQTDDMVRTIGLTKVFRDFWLRQKVAAVVDLDMEVRSGEVFGLLGPNGSGKSTTIKMILGLLFPTQGRVRVLGHGPTHVRVKSRIGFLPEESHLYPFLNAYETLEFYGRLFRLPRAQRTRRVEMLLDMVGLSSVAYRRVGEYSKGMQRRIGLAQALINDPDLLILDEPTSGLDPLGTRQFKDLIRTLGDRGKTVILSSHLLGDVEDVCDRVCVLYGGKKQAEGDINDLLSVHRQTQITVEDIDEATLGKVRSLLSESGAELMNVSHPREKLEALFLRTVEQARQTRQATGGADMGGPVADFLTSSSEGRTVIESLMGEEPAPEEPETPSVSEETTAPHANEAMIESLVTPKKELSEEEPPREDKAEPKGPLDRGVIDDLLDGGER